MLWSVAGHQALATLEGHSDAVGSVAFSSDGSILGSASWGRDGQGVVDG